MMSDYEYVVITGMKILNYFLKKVKITSDGSMHACDMQYTCTWDSLNLHVYVYKTMKQNLSVVDSFIL